MKVGHKVHIPAKPTFSRYGGIAPRRLLSATLVAGTALAATGVVAAPAYAAGTVNQVVTITQPGLGHFTLPASATNITVTSPAVPAPAGSGLDSRRTVARVAL